MTKKEAEKQAKKAVKLLKKVAISRARSYGVADSYYARLSTGELIRRLSIDPGWEARAVVKRALTVALTEAVSLGLVSKSRGRDNQTTWLYLGPEVAQAVKAYADERKAAAQQLRDDLAVLGLPRKAASTIDYRGRIELTPVEIRKAAKVILRQVRRK